MMSLWEQIEKIAAMPKEKQKRFFDILMPKLTPAESDYLGVLLWAGAMLHRVTDPDCEECANEPD